MGIIYPSLDGEGQATHAAADSGESSGVHADVCQGRANPLGYVGSGALGNGGGRGWALVRVGGESGEERGAIAADMRTSEFSAGGKWTYVELVHVQSHLMVDVEFGVRRFAEAHVVALALLVLFAFPSVNL